jgi:hypothetical protein
MYCTENMNVSSLFYVFSIITFKRCHLFLYTNCQSHWVLCCLMFRGKWLTCDLWLAWCLVPFHQGIYHDPQSHGWPACTSLSKCILRLTSVLLFNGHLAAICGKSPPPPVLSASELMGKFSGWPLGRPSGSGSRILTCQQQYLGPPGSFWLNFWQ